jgi:MFS transporter, ACS family, hexuronate transporter
MTYYRWKMIALAFIAVIITYLDRSALSYAIEPIQAEFGFTNTDFGLIASAFGIGYMIMTIGGGILVDVYGARKIWTIFSIFWSLACAGLGFASGLMGFFIFRLVLGLAEGPSFPALTRTTADWLPVSERARSLAIGLAAVPFASVIGAPFISFLITRFGWQLMFIILGALGIVWAIVWYLVFRDHPSEMKKISREELAYIQQGLLEKNISHNKISILAIICNRSLLINNYAFFSFGYLLFFAITWLPGYLQQTYHIDLHKMGWFLIAPWITSTILLVLGGILSDAIWHRTKKIRLARSHLIWVSQILSAVCLIPVIFSPSLTVALICISLGIGFGLMPNAAFYAINADLARERAATSLGIMDSGFALAGILAPSITGWLANITGNFNAAIGLLIVLTFTSAIAVILWQHPDESSFK